MGETTLWYIVKAASGTCQIVATTNEAELDAPEQWGPFNSQGEAIAKRVGLIRAGKCQPE